MKSRTYEKLAIPQIENLVFQGGSVKGIAYLGAWEAMQQLGLNPLQIKRVGGASAGSITALLFALGYTDPLKLLNIMNELSFTSMLDEPNATIHIREPLLKIKDKLDAGTKTSTFAAIKLGVFASPVLAPVVVSRLINEGGIFNGDYLEHWFEKLIQERTGLNECTFAQLKELQTKRPELNLKDLYVVVVNKEEKRSEILSYETNPNAVISKAVRASMSIPLVFKPAGVYLDGGLLDNYPLFMFDHIDDGRTTLGFQLLSPEKIDRLNGNLPKEPKKKSSLAELAGTLDLTINTRSAKQLSDHQHNPDHQSRSVQINTLGVGTLDFNLREATKKALIESGRAGVLKYFRPNGLLQNSKVLEELEHQKLENSVIVYVWASKINPTEHGHALGHVSIQTTKSYISLWPAEASNSPQKKASEQLQKFSDYSSENYTFQPSIDADIEASNGYLPNYEIRLETLDCAEIEKKFDALKQKIMGWAVIPGLCKESCASIAAKLLTAGGINSLVSNTERIKIASTGGMTGSHAALYPKAGQTRKDASVGGSVYGAEMLASPIIDSPDSLLEILKIAAKNEKERTRLPSKIAMRQ